MKALAAQGSDSTSLEAQKKGTKTIEFKICVGKSKKMLKQTQESLSYLPTISRLGRARHDMIEGVPCAPPVCTWTLRVCLHQFSPSTGLLQDPPLYRVLLFLSFTSFLNFTDYCIFFSSEGEKPQTQREKLTVSGRLSL